MKKFVIVSVAAAFLLLTGCGGGSDSANNSASEGGGAAVGGGSSESGDDLIAATPNTGIFIDSAVEGLDYSTATQSGKTGSDGSFKYLSGEAVTFSLYGKPLFSPKGFSVLTPFDLSDTSVNLNYSVNLIRFFLALDEDGNPNNGIKLPAYSGTLDVDFNKSIRDFEIDADGKVAAFLAANAKGRSLATIAAAVTHFNNSLANVNPVYNLSLSGRTATSIIKNTNCTNNVTTGWRYTFGEKSVRLIGSDGFFNNGDGNCVASPESDETIAYAAIGVGQFLDCAPSCSYKQLNRIAFIPSDDDGRTAVEWSWHTPNSKKIYYVKTILADPGSNNHPASLNTFVEVITLN